MSDDEQTGGRVFFSNTGRTLEGEDEIHLLSVGVDIGSSTSHLVFSRIVLERLDSRYVVASREAFYESKILLTPYAAEETIDAKALAVFLDDQYARAGVDPDAIDTGALILTGVAVRRRNARAIGELFAREAGKMVAVSAGDSLETTMAAYGSGAVSRSIRERTTVMNVDVGGGTSKIAICADGKVIDQTAIDVGARLICTDAEGRITRIEEAGRRVAAEIGLPLQPGRPFAPDAARQLAAALAERLFEAMGGQASPLLRLDPLKYTGRIDQLTFSGGVSEYIYGRETGGFGDLGPLLAAEIKARAERWTSRGGPGIEPSREGIRATVIGASQYTVQVSGSTIFVSPLEALPLRNVAVIAPDLPLAGEAIDRGAVAASIAAVLKRLDLAAGEQPVAVFAPWQGSATFQRLDAFCRGVADGLSAVLANDHPLILAGDGDVGGLIGMHCREELRLNNAIVSIDGLDLKEFDYIDIGEILEASGAVPVVIKSLVFPSSDAVGKSLDKHRDTYVDGPRPARKKR
ncbi:MAG TPA: ethanolamine ammonia-lyase reactivating factor EutA [Alphaproteobacteria bacterium]